MRKILKGAVFFLIVTSLVISSFAVSAITNYSKPEITLNYTLKSSSHKGTNIFESNEPTNRRAVLWDNGMPPADANLYSSQRDDSYPFISQVADDFKLEVDAHITGFTGYGSYWNGDPVEPIDMIVYFYEDDGTGASPTGSDPDPSGTAIAIHEFFGVVGLPYPPNLDILIYDLPIYPPLELNGGEKYWVVIQAWFDFPPQWGWTISEYQLMSYAVQGFPLAGISFWTQTNPPTDMAFTIYGGHPDVCCSGSLFHDKVKPGAKVTGEFTIENCGDYGTELDWEVYSWPNWGSNWVFTPSSGSIYIPPWEIVTVSYNAPSQHNHEYYGEIWIRCIDNHNLKCSIPVNCITPTNYQFNTMQSNYQTLLNLLNKFLQERLNLLN
jgi:hypothetical protein